MTVGDEDLCFAPAKDLARAFRAREVSPVEVMEALVDRIERLNPAVNAFVTLLAEDSLAQAREAETRFAAGRSEDLAPLSGIPVMVKDLTATAGVRTTFGSPSFADHVPQTDAPIWARLKKAGAILLGKTTTPEFGEKGVTESALTGVTNNPWDTTRTAGGSSGGSAAALAAGFGPLATGSDSGGSIRVPASFCGVVGLKPSPGRIPFGMEESPFDSVSVVGPMTRTVADCAFMLSLIAGPDPGDPVALPATSEDYLTALEDASMRGLRVAVSPDLGLPPIEPQVRDGLVRAAVVFEQELGAVVDEVQLQLPDPFEYFIKCWGPQGALLMEQSGLAADDSPLHAEMDRVAKEMSALDYARVLFGTRAAIHRAFSDVFAEHDLLLMPTTPMVAFPHPGPPEGPLEVAGKPSRYPMLENQRCTEAIAHAGYPAISVPCGFTAEGLPIGLQIAGPHRDEMAILRAAAAFEAAAPWAGRRPPL